MVLDCNCVTYDEATGFTFAGVCFYNCMNNAVNADWVYHILPKKAFDLNCSQSACSWFNRKGLLCGEYDKGFSPFVISYDLMQLHEVSRWRQELVEVCCNCFYCSQIFYSIIVIFKINVTSSRLHGVIWFSQTISVPALILLFQILVLM